MHGTTAVHICMVCTRCGHTIGNEGAAVITSKEQYITLIIPPCSRCNLSLTYKKDEDWGFHE